MHRKGPCLRTRTETQRSYDPGEIRAALNEWPRPASPPPNRSWPIPSVNQSSSKVEL